MKKAVFLDRDGVINVDASDYTWQIEDFTFTPNLFADLLRLQQAGYIFIVITNQGGIAKKLYTHHDVHKLHKYMEKCFSEEGIQLTDIYFCPHHHTISRCLCRKPGSLMIEKALATYNISAKSSYLIGDNERDVLAAEAAGVKGLLIEPNKGITQAVQRILQA